MKVEINIDPNIKETLIKIFAQSMNNDVALVQSILGTERFNRIIGLKNDEIILLETDEVIRFFTNDKKVLAQTMTGEYLVRLRMYDLEERLRSTTFIRISQGELVNLDYVKELDLSYKGTIALKFKTGQVSYVSRRSLKNFKKELGI